MISNHIGPIKNTSRLYVTEAWGYKDQDDFINQAIVCQTQLDPKGVLAAIDLIETKMGRQKTVKWGPRIIDVDIIFFGDAIIEEEQLKIPHPELTNRKFVLVTLLDICPDKIHPKLGQSIKILSDQCPDTSAVYLY